MLYSKLVHLSLPWNFSPSLILCLGSSDKVLAPFSLEQDQTCFGRIFSSPGHSRSALYKSFIWSSLGNPLWTCTLKPFMHSIMLYSKLVHLVLPQHFSPSLILCVGSSHKVLADLFSVQDQTCYRRIFSSPGHSRSALYSPFAWSLLANPLRACT